LTGYLKNKYFTFEILIIVTDLNIETGKTIVNCPNCGGTVPPNTNRCIKCGSFIEQQQPVQPVQVIQPLVQQPPQEIAVTQDNLPVGPPVKSKVAAGLLGIFLGGLGIHRYYLGYAGIGTIMLLMTLVFSWLTCGATAIGAGVWGLIEGILILSGVMDVDAKGRPLIQ